MLFRSDLVNPMTLGSMTTVLAFFCLQLTNASVLRDVGLFAGFSLIGAALCSLIFLPHFISASLFHGKAAEETWIERIPFATWFSHKYFVLLILLVTPVFFYFALQVSFDNDVSNLNFMSDETRESQSRLEAINRSSANTVFVVSRGKDLESTLRGNEKIESLLNSLKDENQINKYSSVSTFLISDSLQRKRIEKWNEFWTPARIENVVNVVRDEGKKLGFSPVVINNVESLLSRKYIVVDTENRNTLRTSFFDD